MVAPSPGHVFFEQTVFKAEIGHQFLQRQSLGAQILHLACIRLAGRITGQPLLAGLEKFLRPAVIQALGDPLFVRARYGVAPTQIAIALREKLQPLLEEVGIALTQTQGFNPAQSTRVFKVHMTDIGQLVFLPGLNNFVAKHAPGIRLVIKNLGWEALESGLSSGEIDLAIGSLPMIKGRVHSRVFRHERYVTAMRKGHPLAKNELDLEAFVAADHLAIDATSSGHSLVENALRALDMRRNISLTIPHYLAAEQILVSSNYLLTVPNVAVLSFQDPAALCIVRRQRRRRRRRSLFFVFHWGGRQQVTWGVCV